LEEISENSEEVPDEAEESELSQSDPIEDIEEIEPIEEAILTDFTNDEEETISLKEDVPDESEDDFSEFDEEESLMDIAAEVLSEEIESEKKVGFFSRLARSLSFGRKN